MLASLMVLPISLCIGQPEVSICKKSSQLIQVFNNYHLQPPQINDVWSEQVYDEFFYLLDPGRRFFSLHDLAQLDSDRTKLDELVQGTNCAFVDKVEHLYKFKLTEASQKIEAYLKLPLNYSVKGSASVIQNKSNSLLSDQAAFDKGWKISLKLQVLYWMLLNTDEELFKLSEIEFKKLEASARVAIQKKEAGTINRLLNPASGFHKSVETIFLKAIAHSFDPHSEYFTPSQHEEFNSALSVNELSFGFSLKEDPRGQIAISRLTPGGAAWTSSEINQDDKVLGVQWGTKPPIDIIEYSIEELEDDLASVEHTQVVLNLKKANGQIKSVQLVKNKIDRDENMIQSFLLKGKKTIGYIELPGFYTEFEDATSKGCADDVARELIKLKREKIEGLILDLRFNGGGSLQEALALAGIFIDVGPLALIQETGQPVVTLKDLNRGTIYDGALVILVNGFSASASELVSAVLQDLNRSIIVGSKTYGKATGQIIMPIDSKSNAIGFIKVTNDRIYRVTGKSLQRKGVTPDIQLPDFYESYFEREISFSNSIAADSTNKKVYYTPLPSLSLETLKTKSKERTISSQNFDHIVKGQALFSEPVPLSLADFAEYIKDLNRVIQKLETGSANSLYKVQIPQFDNTLMLIDNHRKEVRQDVLDKIQRSPYIEEAFAILLDYLSLPK